MKSAAPVRTTSSEAARERGARRPFFARPAGVQAKLRVGKPGDRFEREADAAADAVVHARGPLASGGVIAGRLTSTAQRAPEDETEAQAMSEREEIRMQTMEEEEAQTAAEPDEMQHQGEAAEEEEPLQAQSEAEEEEAQTQADEEDVAMSEADAEEEDAQASAEEEEAQLQGEEEEEALQTEAEEEEAQPQADEEDVAMAEADAEEEDAQASAEEEEAQLAVEADAEEEEAQLAVEADAEEEDVQARGPIPGPAPSAAKTVHESPDSPERQMAAVERRLRAARGLGNPLPDAARARMETRLGADLSGVRIHTDALAVELSQALRAKAFAHGRDIYFNQNQFRPGAPEGDHLLAHELAHTVQQGAVKAHEIQLASEQAGGGGGDPETMLVRPELLDAIRRAQGEVGRVNAKITGEDGGRVGWQRLQEYFRTAFGGDVIHPDAIRNITIIGKGDQKKDAMPHWCGIFAWWALKSSGVPLPDWKLGMNVLEFMKPRPPGSLPQKGDIAYRHKHPMLNLVNDHFALVSGLESAAAAEGKAPKSVQVATVNGNTAGQDNLGGQVEERWGPVGEWDVFFDPVSKLEMPPAELVAVSRAPEDTGAAADEADAAPADAASKDPGPNPGLAELEESTPVEAEALPGPNEDVAVDLPPPPPTPPPTPPPEPKAVVEPLGLEGSSDAAMTTFVDAKPSRMAISQPKLGPALDGKVVDEQAEAAAEAPDLKAETGGDADPGVTPADQLPIPAGADLSDGVTGQEPGALAAAPHADKAPPPSTAGTKKELDRQPEGGFLAWLRNNMRRVMSSVRTVDDGVSTSAGERPQVALEGEADPGRMARQQEEGAGQLRAERDAQVQGFKEHPGQANIKPRLVDEARKPALKTEPSERVPDTPADDAVADYADADLPKEVRDRSDDMLQPGLSQNLGEARSKTRDSAAARDKDKASEIDTAKEKARQLSQDADTDQRKTVADNRKEVARQQGEGIGDAYKQVQQFADDGGKKQQDAKKEVSDKVKTTETDAKTKLEDGEKEAEKKKKEHEAEAATKKRELEEEQKKESWWDRAVNLVKKAVKALTDAIDGIFNALRAAVKKAIEAAKKLAVGLINAARTWIVDKLNKFRDWAKSQVDKYLKDSFPGLAKRINAGIDATVDVAVAGVNAVADGLIAAVEKLADALAAALDKILAIYQAALKAAVQIAGAVLTGDFVEALKIAIRAACEIAGVDPQPIFDFFERAAGQIKAILKAPMKFINNVMKAVGLGITMFGKNIKQHLINGMIAWLTGALSAVPITLPQKWDIKGIFSLVAQILGLTYENIKARIIKKVPAAAKVFDLVEKGFALIQKLRNLDFSALWEEIKAKLANLKEIVIGGIRNWVITKVIQEGIVWLLSLTNPASALVKAVKLIYDLVMWLVQRFEQIKSFVLSVYDAVTAIASGVIQPAAKAIEAALARSLPVVISMIASFIGLGDIGQTVQNLLAKITKPINRLIDALIDRIVAYAKKLLQKAKAGAKKVAEKVKAFLWPKKAFKAGEESHTLYFEGKGAAARLFIRSTPTAVTAYLDAAEAKYGAKMTATEKGHLKTARTILSTKIEPLAKKIAAAEAAGKAVPDSDRQKMLGFETELADAIRLLVTSKAMLAKAIERYKLEGLTGTYGTIPRPSGDQFTPDHQPQASTFKYLAAKPYFKPKEGKALRDRAGGTHADKAYAINLHHYRHKTGRTYGRSPTDFIAAVTAMEKRVPAADKAERRKEAVTLLKDELDADVREMADVYNYVHSEDVWKDLDKFVKTDKEKETLADTIEGQVDRGLATLKAQPLTVLAG